MGNNYRVLEKAMPVINKYHHGGRVPVDAINVMRGPRFGNPFVMGKDGDRGEVLTKYRQWLWNKIQNDKAYADQVRELLGHNLCCCCTPAPCHGDILEAAAKWLNSQGPEERKLWI